MDMVFICRDASASSLVGNLRLALEAKRRGRSVAVLFTGEALQALDRGTFLWPRAFWPQEVRWGMADRARALGLPVSGRGQFRALDATAMIDQAREAGVELLACPAWSPLLGLEEGLPRGLRGLSMEEALELLSRAGTVVGAF